MEQTEKRRSLIWWERRASDRVRSLIAFVAVIAFLFSINDRNPEKVSKRPAMEACK